MHTRTLVVGDIHGAFAALRQVLEKAGISRNDHILFLGDYVDGWPDSARVIEYLMSLSGFCSCTFIKGNHDVWCTSWLAGNDADKTWLENKGESTVQSYNQLDRKQLAGHLKFFSALKITTLILKTGYLFTPDLLR